MPKPLRRRQPPSRLRIAQLLTLGSSCLLHAHATWAASTLVEFDASFLRQAPGQAIGISEHVLQSLAQKQALPAGRYQVQVRLNLLHLGEYALEFKAPSNGDSLTPCLSSGFLATLGLNPTAMTKPLVPSSACIDLTEQVPGALVSFDASKLLLDLSIPQAALRKDLSSTVAPERWEAGIDGAFLTYQASAQHSSQQNTGSRNQYDLYLNSGVNINGWRLRSNQSLRENAQGQRRWTRSNTYAQTDLPGTWGTLTLGETFTNGEVFRSLPLKGVQLASDMGMLPDLMRSYAPVIRGVAQSRAKLEVLQNGYPIYSTYVAAGPYQIDDLGVASSGDLEIVLTEADGQVRRFIQPYSSLSNLLREGVWRYTAALGRYNSVRGIDEPLLLQATLARGISWNSTLYGGVLSSSYYQAGTLGIGRDFAELGAISFDATQACSDIAGLTGEICGQSFAARYAKIFETRTNLRFAGYRYSTKDYRDFDEAVAQRNADQLFRGSRRSRLEASMHQQLWDKSGISLTFSQDDYWNNSPPRQQYQLRFNTQHRGISYNLFASQSLTRDQRNDRLIGLSVSFPLDWANTSAGLDLQQRAGRYSQRASITGATSDSRLSYQAALANDERHNQSADLSVGVQAAYASYGAGYSEGTGYRNFSLTASGSLLAHEQGITFGPNFGETNALIHVPDTPDVGVENAPGVRTNAQGFALASHLQPYRINQMILRTDELGPEVEIDNAVAQAIPRRGAIVKLTYPARQVTRLVLTLRRPNGQPLPFGTQVSDATGNALAVVGQGGQALVATTNTRQTLHARWGDALDERCELTVDPAQMPVEQGYHLQTLTCPIPLTEPSPDHALPTGSTHA
ncbi:fimbria/pilus outer membrane usher protein [Pseudomonas promysalinigenes]